MREYINDCVKCRNYWNNGKEEDCNVRGWDIVRENCPDFSDISKPLKPITNYDFLIRKSPEEMAEFLWSIGNNPATGNVYLNGKLIFFCGDGNGWLDWLRQEAET